MLSVRFSAVREDAEALTALVRDASAGPRVTGAHLCVADEEVSSQGTAETNGRSDLQTPPSWFALIEATDGAALVAVVADEKLRAVGAAGPITRGIYRLEYSRTKTAFAAG